MFISSARRALRRVSVCGISVCSSALWTERSTLCTGRRCVATFSNARHARSISIISSLVDTGDAVFKENEEQMLQATRVIDDLHRKVAAGGSARAKEKHLARGKMLPRE